MKKPSINLLQPELMPDIPFWTLKKVVSLWIVTLLLMFGWMLVSEYKVKQLSHELNSLNQQKQVSDELLVNLKNQVGENNADPLLKEKLEATKLLLENKSVLHQQLTANNTTYTAGYSVAMTELSQLHHTGISLQTVQMNANTMTFSGLAKKPEAVPTWLAAFEGSTFLSGQTFNQFSLIENEDEMLQFTVSSQKKSEQNGGKL